MSLDLVEEIQALEPGSHLCLIYEDDPREQMTALAPYFAAGLRSREQCIYVADDQTVDDLVLQLREAGIDVERETATGAFLLWTRREWRPVGELSSDEKAAEVREIVQRALRDGFMGVRFAVEMTWTLGPDIDVASLAHWEATLNKVFTPEVPARIVCQYSRRRFDPDVIRAGLAAHPIAILGMKVCPNPYYETPQVLQENSQFERVDWMVDSLLRAREAEAERRQLAITRARLAGEQQSRRTLEDLYLEAEATREELSLSEEDLRDFFENAVVPLHWAAADGTIEKANQAELVLLGYSEEEYVRHNIREFFEDPAQADDIVSRLRKGEVLRSFEARLRCKDGSLRDVLLDASALRREGRFVRSRCFTRDITDQKRELETILRFGAIVEFSDDAIISKDLDGIIRSWNPAAERMFGYKAEEAIGRSIRIIIPADRQQEEDEILSRLRRGERIDHFETVRIRKDGASVEVSLSVSPIKDSAGRVIGASKIARDITDQKARSAEIGRLQGQRSAIIESVVESIVTIDALGRIVDFNPSAERMFGYQRDEVVGKDMAELLIPPSLRPAHRQGVATLLATGESQILGQRVEFNAMRMDGSEFPIELTVSSVGTGEQTLFTGVMHDISERKAAEEAARQAAALKDQFVSLVSHELRTPISTILGNGLLLQTREELLTPEDRQQCYADIVSESEKLKDNIEHLLLLARLDRAALELEPISLASVVNKGVTSFQARHPRRPIAVDCYQDVPPALGQETLVSLVLQNLLGNADKYSPPESEIEVSLGLDADGNPQIRVRDYGIGLDEQDRDNIFSAFYRSARARDRAPGMGLGLAVCKRVIEAQNGNIGASPRPDGTDFFFSLRPAEEAEAR